MPYPMEPHLPSLKTERPPPVMIAVFPVKNPIVLSPSCFRLSIVQLYVFRHRLSTEAYNPGIIEVTVPSSVSLFRYRFFCARKHFRFFAE